jgi:hypothetical protein
MSVCSRIKAYSHDHEWIADLFSVIGVGLLFASIWVATEYHVQIFAWMGHNVVLRTPAVVGVALVDVLMIFGLLCVGSARCSEEDGCFGTFRGRRHGAGGIGTAFRNWIHHIENVGKTHR